MIRSVCRRATASRCAIARLCHQPRSRSTSAARRCSLTLFRTARSRAGCMATAVAAPSMTSTRSRKACAADGVEREEGSVVVRVAELVDSRAVRSSALERRRHVAPFTGRSFAAALPALATANRTSRTFRSSGSAIQLRSVFHRSVLASDRVRLDSIVCLLCHFSVASSVSASMKDDVVERLEAQREVIFLVHPLQRRQQRIVDLGQIAQCGARSTEPRRVCGLPGHLPNLSRIQDGRRVA